MSMPEESRRFLADLGLIAVAAIWGVNFSVMKVVLGELDPLALNALRFPMAALAMGLILKATPGPLLPDRDDLWRVVLLGVVGNVLYQLCFIIGLDWTLAGNASLLLATTPAWTLLFSRLAGHEALTGAALAGVAATLVGIALVVLGRGEALTLDSRTLAGDFLMLVASTLWALYTVAGLGPVSRYGALRMTTWTLWVGTPILVVLGVPSLQATDLAGVSGGAWLGVVYAGLLSIALAYLLWYRGVRILGNNRTAIYSNLVPVMALLTAWLWLGEVPGALQLIGAAIILTGLTAARFAQSARSGDPGSRAAGPKPPLSSGEASPARWRISGNS
ncbi:MAG: DMT family transporter [Gemmatimonadetes bacterium]|nr:DMT family transporter [Gemmatimonadota bacterium]